MSTVQDGLVVGLQYTLRLDDGQVLEETGDEEPLHYLHGAQNIVSGLEAALTGMAIGDSKRVAVSPEDGYGEYDPEDMQVVDRDLFPKDVELAVGMMLALHSEDNSIVNATVAELVPDAVTLDYNHPLAGETLHFDVKVTALRDATPEEVEHGHAHVPGHHHH